MHITHVKDFSFSPYAMKWVIVHSNNKMLQSFSFMFCNVTHDMLTSKCKEGYLFICDGGDEPSWEQMAMGSYDKTICPDSSAGKNTFPYACHVSWITMSYSKWLMYQYNDCHLAQCSWRYCQFLMERLFEKSMSSIPEDEWLDGRLIRSE